MGRYTAYGVAYSSLILGFGSLLAFVVFLFTGSFSVFDQGWNPRAALYLDACLCLLFFIQHSVLIRRSVRTRLTRWIPDEYYGAFYSMTSGIALTFVLLWWQKTPVLAASAGGMFRWVLHGLFFLCIAGFSWGTRSLGTFDPFGVRKILHHAHQRDPEPACLTVRGAYRWMRHPLYLFTLVMIWSCPDLTADRLLFDVLWTAWIFGATRLEERDLVHDFGDLYREYQARVPMLVPYRIPSERARVSSG